MSHSIESQKTRLQRTYENNGFASMSQSLDER